jgi:hypothetical protein
MKYVIFKTDDGRYCGKILDEKGRVLFETKTYKSTSTVRQHLNRWVRQHEWEANDKK